MTCAQGLDLLQRPDNAKSMNQPRPFTRSRTDRVIAGVMGGIAQRFGWNPTLLRVVFVVLSIASAAFPGILVYLILWLLMPEGDD